MGKFNFDLNNTIYINCKLLIDYNQNNIMLKFNKMNFCYYLNQINIIEVKIEDTDCILIQDFININQTRELYTLIELLNKNLKLFY